MTNSSNSVSSKILITGSKGLIGSYILKALRGNPSVNFLSPDRQELDITDQKKVEKYFEDNHPEVVIHFAAHRDANSAEEQRGQKEQSAWQTNVVGTRNIAKATKKQGAYLIHISTDYVFAGIKKPPETYQEHEEPESNSDLLSWYGVTKREAEIAVREEIDEAAIVRINNITRPQNPQSLDYVGKILWLYDQGKLYPLFDDQYITLTYIPLLKEMIQKLINTRIRGVFHAASTDVCTPFELANYAIEQAFSKSGQAQAVSIRSFLERHPRRYPQFGGLGTASTQRQLGMTFLSWQEMVKAYLRGR